MSSPLAPPEAVFFLGLLAGILLEQLGGVRLGQRPRWDILLTNKNAAVRVFARSKGGIWREDVGQFDDFEFVPSVSQARLLRSEFASGSACQLLVEPRSYVG